MAKSKQEYLGIFRNFAQDHLINVIKGSEDKSQKAAIVNRCLVNFRSQRIEQIKQDVCVKSLGNLGLLNEILMITYVSYVVMLEYRNKVWPYDYMAFSRRVGELWEPFCKLAFQFPIKDLKLINPPNFDSVQKQIKLNASQYIDSLKLDDATKVELKRYFAIPWKMVDSGGIKLALDLHFEQNKIHYNCDFKSGFNSNEKGNTNRLLLVASIYNSLSENEKTILFVRQPEDKNNNYLKTLKRSPYWDVYCANDCYEAIKNFTGFDLRGWLDNNVNWSDDISEEFRCYLNKESLIQYLTW